jgi:hypothetical protein
MTRLTAAAQNLLSGSRDLAAAAALLRSGRSTFGKWCLPGLIPHQCTAALYGPTATGKTFVALHLALCRAAASAWFGADVEPGTVVYLAGEDRPGVEARAVAAAQHMKLPMADLAFEFLSPGSIHVDGWAASLMEALCEIEGRQKKPLAAVFLDTLGSVFGGRSQDDAAQMTLATDAMQGVAERFRCAFIAVHHSGKNEARGLRGSQVLKDRVDTVVALGRLKTGGISINVEKQRNGAAGLSMTCRLEDAAVELGGGHVEHTRVVVDLALATAAPPTAPAAAAPATLSADEKAALVALKAATAPVTVRNLPILTKAALLARKPRGDGAVRTAISHVKSQLSAKQFIEIDEESGIVRICQKASELEFF